MPFPARADAARTSAGRGRPGPRAAPAVVRSRRPAALAAVAVTGRRSPEASGRPVRLRRAAVRHAPPATAGGRRGTVAPDPVALAGGHRSRRPAALAAVALTGGRSRATFVRPVPLRRASVRPAPPATAGGRRGTRTLDPVAVAGGHGLAAPSTPAAARRSTRGASACDAPFSRSLEGGAPRRGCPAASGRTGAAPPPPRHGAACRDGCPGDGGTPSPVRHGPQATAATGRTAQAVRAPSAPLRDGANARLAPPPVPGAASSDTGRVPCGDPGRRRRGRSIRAARRSPRATPRRGAGA